MAATCLRWSPDKVLWFKASIARGEALAGYAAAFVPLDECSGAKMFPTAEWREYAMGKQKIAHASGLAPAVGDAFEVPAELCQDPSLIWTLGKDVAPRTFGYITQRADTSTAPTAEQMGEVIQRLIAVSELNAPSAEAFEDRPENFGVLGGRWVYIDFDEGTWT